MDSRTTFKKAATPVSQPKEKAGENLPGIDEFCVVGLELSETFDGWRSHK